jgi:hypothetical protein
MKPMSVLLLVGPCAGVLGVPSFASDYNGDGRPDLAISTLEAGAKGIVQVLYANASGLSSSGQQTLVAQTAPEISNPTPADFGTAMASGDFDGDGFDDLAVGTPFASFKTITNAGCVSVFRGSATGLQPVGVLHQNKNGMKDKCEFGDVFGWTLAAADFNGDGRDDLAVGVLEKVAGFEEAGAVHVVYGSKKGLTGKKDQVWTQNAKGVEGQAELGEAFGATLAAGDADGDGCAELAIGVPFEATAHSGFNVQGAVQLLRGSKKGLTSRDDALFDNADLNPNNFDPLGSFGATLTFGDFDGNGKRELVIGAPGWDFTASAANDGVVYFVPVTKTTVEFAAHTSLAMAERGMFGRSLQVGNFDGDVFEDLAIGAPQSKFLTGVDGAGVTVVMRGTANGLDALNAVYLTRDTVGVLGAANMQAQFGTALAAEDFNGDGKTDLAISAPYDSIGAAATCGGLNVLLGSATQIVTGANSQWWFGAPIGNAQSSQFMGVRLH